MMFYHNNKSDNSAYAVERQSEMKLLDTCGEPMVLVREMPEQVRLVLHGAAPRSPARMQNPVESSLMNSLRFIALGVACWLYSGQALSEALFVPEDFLTVQAAVDQAVSGDEIYIAPGKYVEKVRIHGKRLSLIGRGDSPKDTRITYSDNWFNEVTGLGEIDSITFYATSDVQLRNLRVSNAFPEHVARTQGIRTHTIAARFDARVTVFDTQFIGSSDTLAIYGDFLGQRVTVVGTNDFVFGTGSALFIDSTLVHRGWGGSSMVAHTGAKGTGITFYRSRFISRKARDGNAAAPYWIARTWRDGGNVRLVDSELDGYANPEGFRGENVESAYFFECGNYGSGADTSGRNEVTINCS